MGCRTEDDDANVIFRTGPRVTHVVLECALVLASTLLETPEQENISLVTCCRKMKVKRSYRCHDGIFFRTLISVSTALQANQATKNKRSKHTSPEKLRSARELKCRFQCDVVCHYCHVTHS